MSIKASRNQDELRLKSPGHRNHDLVKDSQIFLVAPTSSHGKVNCSAFSLTRSGFVHPSCPGIKGILMRGKVKNFRIGIESILSPVAVMDIEISDKNTVEIEIVEGKFGGDRHVIENAEAHCAILNGMVA